MDISALIVAKSDQLNADDLVSGPITVQVLDVAVRTGEQPVTVVIGGGHRPWKPSKTALRVLAKAWGKEDARAWIGKWLTLFRDDTVKWAGVAVGGIRVAAMSHIERRIVLSLAETKGKKITHTVEILKPPTTMPSNLQEHVIAYQACDSLERFAALEAERNRHWATLSKDDKARLKVAADACKARLDKPAAPPADEPPMTLDEAARDAARESNPDSHQHGD